MKSVNIYTIELVKEKEVQYKTDEVLSDPDTVARFAVEQLRLNVKCEEYMYVLTLDTKNQLAGVHQVSQGTLNGALVHPREIFKRALLNNAASILLIHNHPSGNPTPSREDVEMTKRIKAAGDIIGITLLDHIIMGDGVHNYASLRAKELI